MGEKQWLQSFWGRKEKQEGTEQKRSLKAVWAAQRKDYWAEIAGVTIGKWTTGHFSLLLFICIFYNEHVLLV